MKILPKSFQDASETPKDAPTWCQRRPQDRPRGAQDDSRAAKKLPKSRTGGSPRAPWSHGAHKSRPRAVQEPPKSRQRAAQTASRPRSWIILETILYIFCCIFRGIPLGLQDDVSIVSLAFSLRGRRNGRSLFRFNFHILSQLIQPYPIISDHDLSKLIINHG